MTLITLKVKMSKFGINHRPNIFIKTKSESHGI